MTRILYLKEMSWFNMVQPPTFDPNSNIQNSRVDDHPPLDVPNVSWEKRMASSLQVLWPLKIYPKGTFFLDVGEIYMKYTIHGSYGQYFVDMLFICLVNSNLSCILGIGLKKTCCYPLLKYFSGRVFILVSSQPPIRLMTAIPRLPRKNPIVYMVFSTISGGCLFGFLKHQHPGIPTTIKTIGVNITTIAYLRVLIIEIGSTIILMAVKAQGTVSPFLTFKSPLHSKKKSQTSSREKTSFALDPTTC